MLQPYPVSEPDRIDEAAVRDLEWVKQVIVSIRNIRGEMNIPPGKRLPVLMHKGDASDRRRLDDNRQFLMSLARLDSLDWFEGNEPPLSATQLVGQCEVLVPMADLIDKDEEMARLNREIDKLAKEMQRLEGKLGNASFVSKAPADVVEKEKAKLADAQANTQRLQEQLEKIRAI